MPLIRALRKSRPWQAITTRPHLPIAAYLAYAGWRALIAGDHGSLGVLPAWLAIAWTLALAVGGTLAVVGGLAMAKRTEAAGLALMLAGDIIYGGVFGAALWRSGEADQPIAVSVAIGLMCLIRLRRIRLLRNRTDTAAEVIKRQDVQ